MQKTHPKDWANPGRVKTELKREDGEWINDKITTRESLVNYHSDLIVYTC